MLSIYLTIYLYIYVYESESHSVRLTATPWTIQSMEFSRPEYWNGYPLPSPGDLPSPEIKPRSPTLQADSLPLTHLGSPWSRVDRVGKLFTYTWIFFDKYNEIFKNIFDSLKKCAEELHGQKY